MATRPLGVALVWHMHQPWYRDDVAGTFLLPWVRRRASKDYRHMLRILERHPDVRVTMNMVPSLLAQIAMYADGTARDADLDLCRRDANDLTLAEREFLVASARHDDYGRRVALLSPYRALLDRLGELEAADASAADLRDLQVWSLLAWIDPDDILADSDLLHLATRGRGFAEADKGLVEARQLSLLREVIPAYRAALDGGQVEPMTSPYHHPILPLLIDTDAARVAAPSADLPDPALRAPRDAEEQVRAGLDEFARHAGRQALGMWPSECAVSPAAASLMQRCGVRFAVSDEGVLARTLGRADIRSGAELYSAHLDGSGLSLVFRDAHLSNLVGFSYQSMPAAVAAADLVGRLEEIARSVPADGEQRLATVALDGENFKDFFDENAQPFLDALYSGLVASPLLQSMHIGDFLDGAQPTPLPELWTGSWIDADLRTWIGDAAHGRAWTLLRDTVDAVEAAGGAAEHPGAHHELLVAEASDWYWWFGDHHDSGFDAAWDALYRTHLRNAYALAGLPCPAALDVPIIAGGAPSGDCAPLRAIDPPTAGTAEWGSAGIAVVGGSLGAMRPPASSVGRIRYGAGGGHLHLRFGDEEPRFDRAVVDAGPLGSLELVSPVRNVAVEVPTAVVEFSVTLEESGRGAERVPAAGTIRVAAPGGGAAAPLRVLLVAAECAPFAVAGELAERVARAAAEATRGGNEVVVVIPRHRHSTLGTRPGVRVDHLVRMTPGGALEGRVLQGALPGTGTPVLSIDAPSLFDRPGIYGSDDDGERYLGFCALTTALLDATGFAPDVVHAFEWHTGALPARLARRRTPTATVFTAAPRAPSFTVTGASVAASGIVGLSPGTVDLLELGRATATVTAEGDVDAGTLYERAVREMRSVTQHAEPDGAAE